LQDGIPADGQPTTRTSTEILKVKWMFDVENTPSLLLFPCFMNSQHFDPVRFFVGQWFSQHFDGQWSKAFNLNRWMNN
jgi:hypothetical protein